MPKVSAIDYGQEKQPEEENHEITHEVPEQEVLSHETGHTQGQG